MKGCPGEGGDKHWGVGSEGLERKGGKAVRIWEPLRQEPDGLSGKAGWERATGSGQSPGVAGWGER